MLQQDIDRDIIVSPKLQPRSHTEFSNERLLTPVHLFMEVGTMPFSPFTFLASLLTHAQSSLLTLQI